MNVLAGAEGFVRIIFDVEASVDFAWSLQFTDGTGEKAVRMAEEVYDWFDGMKNPVPRWYADRQRNHHELNR